jgi:16S rRNA (uracil1498-N3)-methyltransferase
VADLGAPAVEGDDAHHLATVRRVRDGEVIVASDGRGAWRPCRAHVTGPVPEAPVTSGRRSRGASRLLLLEPDGEIVSDPAPAPIITIGLSLAKGDRTEWAVAKCVELGVDRIVPLVSDRTVVRLTGGDGDAAKTSRLERVAREAAMQSRRTWLPEVSEPVRLRELFARGGQPAARMALAEPGGAPPTLRRPTILVGPEGGWTRDELDQADAAGVATVGLGDGILRVETAAVAAATLLTALRHGLLKSAGDANR